MCSGEDLLVWLAALMGASPRARRDAAAARAAHGCRLAVTC